MSLVRRSTGAERIPSLGNVYSSPLSQFLLPWLELKALLLSALLFEGLYLSLHHASHLNSLAKVCLIKGQL